MNTHRSAKVYIYCALPCEAKPLIDYYNLKKDTSINCFAVFSNNDIYLTVTGIGKNGMSAGIAYTQAIFPSITNPVMLNMGIAGHQHQPIGSLFLADKITDNDTGRRYYPPLVFTPPCPTANLLTFAKPQQAYPELALCDMEASAFYETATRFTSGELIQCLKIVSDNESSPAQNIQAKQVSALIGAQLSVIECILTELTQLAGQLNPCNFSEFDQLVSQYHFTANEKIQLNKLLSRWRLVKGGNKIEFKEESVKNGNEFLKWLHQQLNQAEFYL